MISGGGMASAVFISDELSIGAGILLRGDKGLSLVAEIQSCGAVKPLSEGDNEELGAERLSLIIGVVIIGAAEQVDER